MRVDVVTIFPEYLAPLDVSLLGKARSQGRLEIAVQKRGTLGKFSRFTIRRGKAPKRLDSCIRFGARSPRACPG